MAVVTGRGEGGGDVIRIVRCLKIRCVTGVTGCGHCLKLAIGGTLVAGVTVDGCMRASEREAVVMLLDLLDRNRPSPYRVTLLTIRSELPPVNIGVAILATLAHIREHRLDVTLDASHGLVHAAQGVPRLIVIELWNSADRTPSACRVTVLTRGVQIPVWTVRAPVGLRLRLSGISGKRQQHYSS